MGKILNKDLFDDPHDLEIAKLKFTISKFKEYDQKRKEYYKSVIEENEQLRQELEDRKTSEKDELIKQLRAKVKALNIRLANYGLSMDGISEEDIARMREENRLRGWKLQIKHLNTEVRKLKDTNYMLICELSQEK